MFNKTRMLTWQVVAFSLISVLWAISPVTAQADTNSKLNFRLPESIPFPVENPYTSEKAALGKSLFFDPRLSSEQNIACASCHNPSFGWEMSTRTSVGALNTRLARQAPTILNVAWRAPFFWDGRAMTVEEQVIAPIENPDEMNLPIADAVRRLRGINGYKDWFEKVFPQRGITPATISEAIATYERTIVSSYAPFDRWVEGDENAISNRAKTGFELFTGKARCVQCHSGWNFTDNKFHDIGTTESDVGRAAITPNDISSKYAFKTPSLRDIAQRAPYMHAGQLNSLRDVVEHYVGGGIERPSRSPVLEQISLSPNEVESIVAFLESLTGARQAVPLPVLPR